MAYLSHVISANGVTIDKTKVEAVEAWSHPQMVKAPCGFLGLMEYCRKFIKGYGTIAAPLMMMLKCKAFSWMSERQIGLQ